MIVLSLLLLACTAALGLYVKASPTASYLSISAKLQHPNRRLIPLRENALSTTSADRESPFSVKLSAYESKAQLIAYIVAGYPSPDETVNLLLSMQGGGATTLQLGVPFANPHADGTVIQKANKAALVYKVTVQQSINMVTMARSKGLTVPVILMGYFDPFMAFGIDNLLESCQIADIGGLSIVDIPIKQEKVVIERAASFGISYVPVVKPSVIGDRIKNLSSNADAGSFLQCVSLSEATGIRTKSAIAKDVMDFMTRARGHSKLPLAASFGIWTPEQVTELSEHADGVVIDAAIIRTIEYGLKKTPAERADVLKKYITILASALGVKKVKAVRPVVAKPINTVLAVDTTLDNNETVQQSPVKQIDATVSDPNEVSKPPVVRIQERPDTILQSDLSTEKIFEDWKMNLSGAKVDSFINARLKECTLRQVGQLMRLLGKKSSNKSYLLKRHLPAIALHLETYPVKSWNFNIISALLYGLQCLQCNDEGCASIMRTVTPKFATIPSNQILSRINLSMLMIGLQRMSSDDEDVRSLVAAIAIKLNSFSEVLHSQGVGNALYGLRCMSDDYLEVRSLVSALASKVKSCRETLNCQEVGNALYGLQGMSSDNAEVLSLVSALAGKVNSCKEALDGQAVANAMFGLRGMSSDSVEVRSLVSALAGKVNSCSDSLNRQEVANAVYGLQSMTCDNAAVRSLVSALAKTLKKCSEPLSARDHHMAVLSLERMRGDILEVESLITV